MPPEPPAEPLDRLLVRVGQALQRFRQRAAAEQGLSATALEVLAVLAEHDALSHRDLAGKVRLTPATLTPVLDALENTGSVARVRDTGDRRVVRISITVPGRERCAGAVEAVTQVMSRLPAPAPEHERAIRAHVHRLLDALELDDDP